MRNDEPDTLDHVPSLRAGTRDDDELLPARVARSRQKAARPASNGLLWTLLCAAFIALAGLGWWSAQQISMLERQLIATQESFARISEEAAGRLQAISGKVAASESSVSSGNETLQQQLRQLQASLAEQNRQQQGVAGQTGDLDKRLEQVLAEARQQQQAASALQDQLAAQLKTIDAQLTALKAGQTDTGKLEEQLKRLSGEVAALKQQGDPQAAIDSLTQDVLVLKSQADNRPASGGGASVQEFDAFRGQTTRSLNTLQSQVQNLQQQINARP